MRFDPFPDAEAVAASIIRDASISDLNGVYSSLPKAPNYPVIVIKRIGGIPAERHRLDRARLQVEVWGTSKSVTRDIAAMARAVLHDAEGSEYALGEDETDAFVAGVEDDLGLTWQPDQATGRDRYLFGVAMYVHSAQGGS